MSDRTKREMLIAYLDELIYDTSGAWFFSNRFADSDTEKDFFHILQMYGFRENVIVRTEEELHLLSNLTVIRDSIGNIFKKISSSSQHYEYHWQNMLGDFVSTQHVAKTLPVTVI